MSPELLNLQRVTAADHPENRAVERQVVPQDATGPAHPSIGFGRAMFGMWIAGMVGSLLTLMTVAFPLGAGDATAALSILPLVLVLIAIVNGWIAANLFMDSGVHLRRRTG